METIIKAVDWENHDLQGRPYVTIIKVIHEARVGAVEAVTNAALEFSKTGGFPEYLDDVSGGGHIMFWAFTEDIPKKILKNHGIKSIEIPNVDEANDTYGVLFHDPEEEDD